MLDKGQTFDVDASIATLVTARALGPWNKPNLLVVADRLDLHVSPVESDPIGMTHAMFLRLSAFYPLNLKWLELVSRLSRSARKRRRP